MHSFSTKLLIIVVVALAFGCQTKDRTERRVRPAAVPDSAIWVDSNWYVVHYLDEHRNRAFVRVYDDQDGHLIVSKRLFILAKGPFIKPNFLDSLADQIKGFDGKHIYLKPENETNAIWLQD